MIVSGFFKNKTRGIPGPFNCGLLLNLDCLIIRHNRINGGIQVIVWLMVGGRMDDRG
jgi:hypothetical protein